MKILVAGGAGYIGSIVVEDLVKQGYEVTILDNLTTGHRGAINPSAKFIEGDIRNADGLKQILLDNRVDVVMHFCARSLVGESVEKPLEYYENNVTGGINLLQAMLNAGVKRIIFSSTAATFGEPDEVPITEQTAQKPTNPYGETKLAFEHALRWTSEAHGLQYVALRYFNACGASEKYGENHNPETHLIPIILQVAQGKREQISIFGTDYETDDGSCVRDYIHVADLSQAHILAMEYLCESESNPSQLFNLGNGSGYSVLEVIEAARKVTGHPIPPVVSERRAGDPAVLIAGSDKVRSALGWKPQYPDLETIIESAWKWHQLNPDGYAKK